MTEYRLVVQVHTRTWGSEGLELTDRRYVLQRLNRNELWKTLPIVDFDGLSPVEQKEIYDALL